jgi:hypothetical protein
MAIRSPPSARRSRAFVPTSPTPWKRRRNPPPEAPKAVAYLAGRMNDFWTSLDSVFALAESGHADKADEMIRVSIQARQESLSNAVSRLLVQNNESEERAAEDTAPSTSGRNATSTSSSRRC